MLNIVTFNSEDNSLVECSKKDIYPYLCALKYENNYLENYAESVPLFQRIWRSDKI